MTVEFADSEVFLREAVRVYLRRVYEPTKLVEDSPINGELQWRPSMHFSFGHELVAIEVSEEPYPMILRLVHADIVHVHEPIRVIACCPEAEFLKRDNQRKIRDLKKHGMGLLSVDESGEVTERHTSIALIQHVPDSRVRAHCQKLPKSLRQRINQAYEAYESKANSGLQDCTEILEDFVVGLAKKMAKKGELSQATVDQTTSAVTLCEHLQRCPTFNGQKGVLVSARSGLSRYRNPAHHAPRSRRKAYERCLFCRDGFLETIKLIEELYAAARAVGVRASLASSGR